MTDRDLMIRYGPWRLRTGRDNVTAVELSGPYRWWRAIGPHLSLADGGASSAAARPAGSACASANRCRRWCPGAARHPAATVTVADPAALARLLAVADLS